MHRLTECMQYTIRGIPSDIDNALRKRAALVKRILGPVRVALRDQRYPPACSCRYVWFWFTHQYRIKGAILPLRQRR